MKTCGSSKTESKSCYNSSAPRTLQHQVGESVTTHHLIINKREESRVKEKKLESWRGFQKTLEHYG